MRFIAKSAEQNGAYLATHFTDDDLTLYSVLLADWSETVDFHVRIHRQRREDAEALGLIAETYQMQYLQVLAIAERATQLGIVLEGRPEWDEAVLALAQKELLAQEFADGLNPFGFDERNVPLYPFDQLLDLARSLQASAEADEQIARSIAVNFDSNADSLRQQLFQIKSQAEQIFMNCVDLIPRCVKAAQWSKIEMHRAATRVVLTQQRLEQIPQQIEIEQQRAGEVITIITETGEQLSALSYEAGVIRSYTVITTDEESSSSGFSIGLPSFLSVFNTIFPRVMTPTALCRRSSVGRAQEPGRSRKPGSITIGTG